MYRVTWWALKSFIITVKLTRLITYLTCLCFHVFSLSYLWRRCTSRAPLIYFIIVNVRNNENEKINWKLVLISIF